MDFALTQEHDMLVDALERLLERTFNPEMRRQTYESDLHATAAWEALAENGFLGLALPDEAGGAGLGTLEMALTAEVCGHHALAAPFIAHAVASVAIARGGSADQRAALLPQIADGRCMASIAVGEPGDAWSPSTWQVKFRDGRLSGQKVAVPVAQQADLLVVGTSDGRFVACDTSAPSIAIARDGGVDRGNPTYSVTFDETPAIELASGQRGWAAARQAGLALLAADAFGTARRCLDMTIEHVTTREQFGRPLVHNQSIRHSLADMAATLESARGLIWSAAAAPIGPEGLRLAQIAKAHVCDVAETAVRQCVVLHGAIGFTWEYDLHFWLKRMMFNRVFLGTPRSLRREVCAYDAAPAVAERSAA